MSCFNYNLNYDIMEEERTVVSVDNYTFFLKIKEVKDDTEKLIELLSMQAKETNDPNYWYLIFKHLNNYYIDFNPDNVKGLEFLEKAIKIEEETGYRIFNKSYYKLDYEFMVLLSKIDNYINNIIACGTSPMYNYIDGQEYIELIDLKKLNGHSFDNDYLVYMSRLYMNHLRVEYKCSLICLYLMDEKYYEKIAMKSLLDFKANYHKDYKKIKKLSDFDKVSLLKKYSSYIFNQMS